jgi:hypothetical protein
VNWSILISLLRTILYGWVISLWWFLKWLWALLHQRRRPQRPEHRPTSPTSCTPIDHPAFVRPDPLLYSQRYLMDRGLAVTWDNPDIVLFRNGAPVSSSDLAPATTYDVEVRIWNNSIDAPVVAMPVHLLYRSFGVGTQDHPITTVTVDVGVKGSADQPAFVSIPWTTPVVPGHYCLQAFLDPADDIDPTNNLGWENTRVREAQSPASFTFDLRNDTRRERTYRFELDGYELPPRQPCVDEEMKPAQRLERHHRGHHPVPAGFDVQITPASPRLAPGHETTITVTAEPPTAFQGRQNINVNVFHDQGLAGGVTLTVVKEP